MLNKILSLTAIVLLTSSCSIYHVSSTPSEDAFYPSKEIVDVAYLASVSEDHEVIGSVTVNAERRQRLDDVITKMKREAAILGGDAITDIQTDATGAWKRLPIQKVIGNAYVRANFTASVIVFNKTKTVPAETDQNFLGF